MSRKRKHGLSAEEEELDEWMCRAMNPDDQVRVLLPSGASARVARDVSAETLMALDRMAVAAYAQYIKEREGLMP